MTTNTTQASGESDLIITPAADIKAKPWRKRKKLLKAELARSQRIFNALMSPLPVEEIAEVVNERPDMLSVYGYFLRDNRLGMIAHCEECIGDECSHRYTYSDEDKAHLNEVLAIVNRDRVSEQVRGRKKANRRIKLTAATEIEMVAMTWLWQDRLPTGSLCVLTGDGEVGKSTLALTWAADLTQGRLPGIYFGQSKSVIIYADEDNWGPVTKPRLMAAGADMSRVYRLDPVDEFDGVSLPRDIQDLIELIAEKDVVLVIMDPFLSLIDQKIDTHKDAEARRALGPLKALAEKTSAVVLGFIHFNKGESKNAIKRVSASGAMTKVPRSVFAVVQDDNDVRVLGHIKNNVGLKQPDLAFTIEKVALGKDASGREMDAGKVVWQENSARGFQEIMDAAGGGSQPTRQGCADWVRDFLIENGPTPAAEVKQAAITAGVAGSEKTVERAAKTIGVHREDRARPGVKGTYAVWSLDGEGEPDLLAGMH